MHPTQTNIPYLLLFFFSSLERAKTKEKFAFLSSCHLSMLNFISVEFLNLDGACRFKGLSSPQIRGEQGEISSPLVLAFWERDKETKMSALLADAYVFICFRSPGNISIVRGCAVTSARTLPVCLWGDHACRCIHTASHN